jgi:hypothetical protein
VRKEIMADEVLKAVIEARNESAVS